MLAKLSRYSLRLFQSPSSNFFFNRTTSFSFHSSSLLLNTGVTSVPPANVTPSSPFPGENPNEKTSELGPKLGLMYDYLDPHFNLPPQHIDTEDNNINTPFDFTEEEYKQIDVIVKKYPKNYKQSATIPLLYIAQKNCGNWIPLSAMNKIAQILDLHPMRVYEVATFYTMFNRERVGKYHLQVCGTTPCMVSGSDNVFRAIKDHLNIEPGHGHHTTHDGMFTVTEVECLAACANAPMIQVNNEEVYEDLNYENTKKLLDDLRNGNAKVGPQNGRNQAEGIQGRTTLKSGFIDSKEKCRDFEKLKKELEEKSKDQQQQQQQPPKK